MVASDETSRYILHYALLFFEAELYKTSIRSHTFVCKHATIALQGKLLADGNGWHAGVECNQYTAQPLLFLF